MWTLVCAKRTSTTFKAPPIFYLALFALSVLICSQDDQLTHTPLHKTTNTSAEDTVAEVNKREKQGEVHPKKAKIMAWDSGIKMFTALHSAALTAYSWWTFVNAYAAVMASTEIYLLANPGMSFTTALVHNCIDKKSNLWMNNDFATITIHFYLSKFWEVST